jgi:hypothetical protein
MRRAEIGHHHIAGVTSRLWEIGDIVDVLEAWETLA